MWAETWETPSFSRIQRGKDPPKEVEKRAEKLDEASFFLKPRKNETVQRKGVKIIQGS